ncbi:MAG: transcriptional repressor LexA [Verrucomicrobia bacterium]|nr:transcriptional repressor LexA [Verrucomicrobiota bacterium]
MPRTIDLQDKVQRLRAFYARERRAPGYNEMLKLFRYRSKNAVYGLLKKLEAEGYVAKKHGKLALTPKLTGAIRMLGSVQAGFPSPAEEELLDTLSLDELLVDRPEATYMLRVSGDSMIDAGIFPGDIVLVEKGKAPRNNDVVIAQVDGEWTMKFFVKKGKDISLEAANKKYKTIRPRDSLEIGGIVRTVIRKYT